MKLEEIKNFLETVDCDFPVPLSKKQNLTDFALKINDRATLCVKYDQNKIVAMVAGYTDKLTENLAYISIVGVVSQYRRYGFASALIEEFLKICRDKKVQACHVYTDKRNLNAVKMYTKCGFQRYFPQKEDRPNDIHLIYYF